MRLNFYGHWRPLYQWLTGKLFHLGSVFLLVLIVSAVLCQGLRAAASGVQ